uniref:TTF-type domain-containing protein n=1 Tax=Salarias fasciatus TaxID=181472 RepID=A0A672IQM3_SALFA
KKETFKKIKYFECLLLNLIFSSKEEEVSLAREVNGAEMNRFVFPKRPRMEKKTCDGGETSQACSIDENPEMPGPEQDRRDEEGQLPAFSADNPCNSSLEDDISSWPCDGPMGPVLQKYPSKPFGNQQRSFNKSWMDQYTWLEYSMSEDAAFCFSCRHFLKQSHGFHIEPTFTSSGFNNWRKASASLKSHHESMGHKFAMEAWSEFKQTETSGSRISNMLDKGHSALVMENRRYMKAVVESLRYTACQGIAQRGHSEAEESANRGNFRELLDVIGLFDPVVKKKLDNNPSNAKYIHHDIQNEIFSVMAKMIRTQISDEVRDAEYFAILVDESKDVSKKEQISVIVCHLKQGTEQMQEEFLHFTAADGLVAGSLLASIKHTLSQCNINLQFCVGQCYDGASVMSGCNNGVQAVIAVIDEKFVLHLILFEDVFRTTKFMSDQLQTPDLAAADDLAESVITALSEKRTEEKWKEIREQAEDLCAKTGLSSLSPRERRPVQTARRLEGFVVEAPLERTHMESLNDLKIHSFFPVIDKLLMEMKRRFSTETNNVLRGVPALSPKHSSFLDKEHILPMARHYGIGEENLSAELYQVRQLFKRKEEQGHQIGTTQEILSLMRPYKDAFIDLFKLLSISLTLPVTSVSCERSFSCLRRLKNYLRNTSEDS